VFYADFTASFNFKINFPAKIKYTEIWGSEVRGI
jgi:hypothetical protein